MIKRTQSTSRGKSAKKIAVPAVDSTKAHMVTFSFGESTYTIDVERRKVYQRWVEVERMKGSAIINAFRSQNAARA